MPTKTYYCNQIDMLEKVGDIVFFSYSGKISLTEELKEPTITKRLAKISAIHKQLLFVNFVAGIDDKEFLSVMVIDCGKILGVSDSLTDDNFFKSSQQRIYATSLGKVGVVVGCDLLVGGSVGNLAENGADFIVHMSKSSLDKKYLRALKAHSVFYPLPIFSAFSDAFCVSCNGFLPRFAGDSLSVELFTTQRIGNMSLKFLAPSFEY